MLIWGGVRRISGGGEGWDFGVEMRGEGFEVMPAGVDVRDVDTKEEIDQARRD